MVRTPEFKDLTLTVPSDGYTRLLKGYKATGIVWAFVDLVRLIPVLHFPPLRFAPFNSSRVFSSPAFSAPHAVSHGHVSYC